MVSCTAPGWAGWVLPKPTGAYRLQDCQIMIVSLPSTKPVSVKSFFALNSFKFAFGKLNAGYLLGYYNLIFFIIKCSFTRKYRY